MWADARSRAAYQYFGDVVCFDSTYLTNEYHLPFSNFVGVNHHGQTILLGCALVSHENAETFEWLFKTWVTCMGGKPPAAIMTDQDAAMRKAITSVFPMPDTRHRWCMWHIMNKFGRKLGALSNYQQLKEALQNVIYNSLTPDEFEESWWQTVKKFELQGKECYEWLVGLYEQREMWIPAYVKDVFWAGMQTTQRVESINSFFDGYLNKHTRLFEFAPRYCKVMESRANDEKEADANSSRYVRPVATEFSLERKFQKLYTDTKFVEVQVQCNRVLYLTPVSKKVLSENEEEHVFSDRVWVYSKFLRREIPLSGRQKEYTVLYKKDRKEAFCGCRHFECHGIVCRHIIKVLDMNNVEQVPPMYILDRWRKDIKRKHTLVKVAYHDPSKTNEVRRYDKLMQAVEPVVMRASTSKVAVEIIMDMVQLMSIRIDEVGASGASEGCTKPSSVGTARPSEGNPHIVPSTPCSVNQKTPPEPQHTPTSDIVVKDPEPRGKNKRGRPKGSRLKSAAELGSVGKNGGGNKKNNLNENEVRHQLFNGDAGCEREKHTNMYDEISAPLGGVMSQNTTNTGVVVPMRSIERIHPTGNTSGATPMTSHRTQLQQAYYSRLSNVRTPMVSYDGQMLVGGIHLSQNSGG